ncbi:MAG: hypothetical protein ACJ73E_08035 [Mycobacteriales bacterium]
MAYSVTPAGTYHEPLQQFALVLASVAAGAIFLPELSSNLWTMSSQQVQQLVPEERRRRLAQALIGAESDDAEWNELVYSQALVPLLTAGRQSYLVVRNMNYSVQVHLNQRATVGGTSITFHSVETSANSERVLPPAGADGSYWISVARSERALAEEFKLIGCLARELVPLDGLIGSDWAEAMKALCRVFVSIDGQVQDVKPDEFSSSLPDVVRWRFKPEIDAAERRVPVQATFDFPVRSSESRFPVIFAGYYCAGSTVINLKVYNGGGPLALSCDSFFGRGPGLHRDGNQVVEMQGTLCQQLSFSTGRESILWPGSGLVFSWSAAPPPATGGGPTGDGTGGSG